MPWPMRFGPPPRMMTLLPVGRLGLALRPADGRRPRSRNTCRACAMRTRRRRCRCACRPAARRAPRRALGDLGRATAGELAQPGVGEAHLLELEQRLGVLGQAVGAHHAPRSRRSARSGAGTTARTWQACAISSTDRPWRKAWAITSRRSGVGRASAPTMAPPCRARP